MTRILVPLPYDISDLAHGRNLRIINLLRALTETETVTCFSADRATADAASGVLPCAEHISADLVAQRCPLPAELAMDGALQQRAVRFFSSYPAMEHGIRWLARDYEIVLGFDLPSLAPLLAAKKANSSLRLAFDVIDDPWLTWSSQSRMQRFCLAGLKSAAALRVICRHVLRKADVLLAVAPRDAVSLSRAAGRPVEVVPNGIHAPTPIDDVGRETLIVFTGTMHFPPNEAAATFFVKRIWPHIRSSLASASETLRARFAIVGAHPSARLRRLAEAAGVEVTGYVDDLHAWLHRARVAVAPMVSGSGMKNKILEACAAGCPVVTTPLGGAGLPLGETHGILCADTPEAFAATVVDLLHRPARADTLGRAAAHMVATRFTWQVSAGRLRSLLTGEALRQGPPSRQYAANRLLRDDSPACPPDAKEAFIHAVS